MAQLQMLIAGYIYNYEHVITLRLMSAMEHLKSCLCPCDEAAYPLKSGVSLLAHDPS
jgi:hypothetical protein